MKMILATVLIMAVAQASYAQSNDQKKCGKEICEEVVLNQALKKYCAENSNDEFEKSVDDWGPYLNLKDVACWCSCKFDVKSN